MSSTITLKGSALVAMAEFANTGKGSINANDYTSGIAIRVTPEHVRLAASNRAILAVANLEVGAPDEALASAADLYDVPENAEEYILPICKVLPALKGCASEQVTIDFTATGDDEARGTITIILPEGYTIRTQPIPTMFRHMDVLTMVTREGLANTTQIALAPTLLAKFVRAAKRLEIPSPERVVIANTGENSALGIKAGLADWFYGILMPMTPPTRYEGTAPEWLLNDDAERDEEDPEPEEVTQLAFDLDEGVAAPMDLTVSDEDLTDEIPEIDDDTDTMATNDEAVIEASFDLDSLPTVAETNDNEGEAA
jgi:hypothetical protein